VILCRLSRIPIAVVLKEYDTFTSL